MLPVKPAFCIIGEPTEMQVAIGHKGKTDAVCTCHGVESHSALAPNGLNAIYLASEMIGAIRELQAHVVETGARDDHYVVPYTTLHVGVIDGGTALNIVPNACKFRFEIRNLLEDDPMALMAKLEAKAGEIAGAYQDKFPTAKIDIAISNEYSRSEHRTGRRDCHLRKGSHRRQRSHEGCLRHRRRTVSRTPGPAHRLSAGRAPWTRGTSPMNSSQPASWPSATAF